MTDYMKIDWTDVRVDDVLMHENGDRLTVANVRLSRQFTEVYVAGGWRSCPGLAGGGFTLHRKVEPVPTEPGAYQDKYGELCVLAPRSAGDPYPWLITHGGERAYWTHANGEAITERAPFTRLVPMPTEADVLDAIEAPEILEHRSIAEDRAAAVMALLRGDGQ